MENIDKKFTLILASASPRRQELLEYADIPFLCRPSEKEEISDKTKPAELVMDLAKLKSEDVFSGYRQDEFFGESFFPFVIGSDTVVSLGDEILGKPKNTDEADKMLELLSGKKHDVLTGVSFRYLAKDDSELEIKDHQFFCKTEVEFAKVSKDLKIPYLETGDSLDKAGAYGVQGKAQVFIKSLNGSYTNVMGFPIYQIIQEIKDLLCGPGAKEEGRECWRNHFKDFPARSF